MPVNALNFPTLNKRLTLGVPLTFAQGDANLTNIQNFCIALANLIAGSLNPDGTLTANAVTAASIEQAAVGIGAINPAALYSLLPVGVDTGTANSNAYQIYTNGSAAPTNLVAAGAVYDTNGNYALPVELTVNLYYYWQSGVNGYDTGIQINPSTTISSSGVFQATQGSVTLKGSIGEPVQAKVYLAANISSYQNGQTFLVYTQNASSGASTLNVNQLGNIPIKLPGNQNTTTNSIGANSVFAVTYWNGEFLMIAGGGGATSSSGNTTIINESSFTGQTVFTAQVIFPGAGGTSQLAHGLGAIPSSLNTYLVCTTSYAGFKVGQRIPLDYVFDSISDTGFLSYADSTNIYVSQSSNLLYTISPSNNAFTGGAGINPTGGSGTGSVVTVAVTSGKVTGVTVTTAGSGYAVGNIVSIPDSTGIGLYATVTSVSSGGITGLNFYINVPITSANFALILSATSNVTYPVPVFPAIEYMANQIEGAMGYGLNLFTVEYGANRGSTNFHNINLQNNEVTLLTPPSGTTYNIQQINGAVFNVTGFNGGLPLFVFGSNQGLYYVSVVSPLNYIVPANAAYTSGGTLTLTVTTGLVYTWTPGVNDFSIQNGSGGTIYLATGGPVTFTAASSAVYLAGVPSVVVTATITTASGVWQPTKLFSPGTGSTGSYKPVAIYPTTQAPTEVYSVSGLPSGNNLSNIQLYCSISSASNQYVGGVNSNPAMPNLNLTNASIQNISAFSGIAGSTGTGWYQAGSTARVMLFQYNPISKRIYVITNETNFIHIFQITGTWTSSGALAAARGTLVDWWAATSGREAALTYVKSIAVSGDGAAWSDQSRENITVDFDMTTGLERAIVFVRRGNSGLSGSVSRVQWYE